MENRAGGKNHIRRILVAVMALLIMASCASFGAESNIAYEVRDYNLHAVVSKDHSTKVVQKIHVNLPMNMESISFVVPNGNYRLYDLKIDKQDVSKVETDSESYIVYDNLDKLTEGEHTYTIEYTLREFEDRDSEKDMYYFDAVLPNWSLPINNLSILIEFPSDFPWSDMQYYAGQYGVQDVNTKLKYKANSYDRTVRITGKRIPENFGIAIKDQLPDGYWQGALDGTWAATLQMIIIGAVLLLLFIFWLIGGRDPKVERTIQDHPISGISPAEIGYIFNSRVRTKDIIALIVYFGTMGYLHISEYAPKKYRLKKMEYPKREKKFVRTAYDILFEDVPDNEWLEIDDLGDKMARIKATIEEDVAAGFSKKDKSAYTSLSRAFRIIGTVLLGLMFGAVSLLKYSYAYMDPNYFEAGIVAVVVALLVTLICRQYDRHIYSQEQIYTIGIVGLIVAYLGMTAYVAVSGYLLTGQIIPMAMSVVGAMLSCLLIIIMRSRAKGNARLAVAFMQLRHFIGRATANVETGRIVANNYQEDKNYYYELLPYALYFGSLESWAITFKFLGSSKMGEVPKPEWYSDDIEGHAFSNDKINANVIDYARDIRSFARTVEAAYRSDPRRRR